MKYKSVQLKLACALIWHAILLQQASAIDPIAVTRSNSVSPVNAKTYRHCHNTPRRVYCHRNEHLPVTVRENAPAYQRPQNAPIK
jgi:hypothetical protein